MSAHSPTRHAPLDLWRIAEAFLHVLHNLFGSPEDLATQHTLTRVAHTMISSWLRAGEAMLRRLLLIEAAAYGMIAPAQRTARNKAKRIPKLASFTADKPEEWRVSFPLNAHRRLPARRNAGGPRVASRFLSAWPLAERFEAMLRVFNAPAAYAKRLARCLAAKPAQRAAVLRAPPEYAQRIERAEELTQAAEQAVTRPDSG